MNMSYLGIASNKTTNNQSTDLVRDKNPRNRPVSALIVSYKHIFADLHLVRAEFRGLLLRLTLIGMLYEMPSRAFLDFASFAGEFSSNCLID